MPNNYVLLERIELNASAASVVFSNIPQTGYTDLKIVVSMRNTGAGGPYEGYLRFNGVSTSTYSDKWLRGAGSGSPISASDATTQMYDLFHPGAGATANTFGNAEIYIPNYTGSTAKSVSMDIVTEDNATLAYAVLAAGLWSGTSAINQVGIFPQSGSFAAGSTFSLYGIAAVGTTPTVAPKASGGNVIATDGTYWYHAFLSNGTFTPQVGLSCDVLTVAGGGGGGYDLGGGGGAGGLLATTGLSVTSATTVTVGAGGAGATAAPTTSGADGTSSIFASLTAIGGGGGGSSSTGAGRSGGSGGGGAYRGNGGTATSGQGNIGGSKTSTAAQYASSGGGGAGAAGSNATGVDPTSVGGAGGAGSNTYSSWATATSTGVSGYFAGGGGGSAYGTSATPASGGAGGGGNGAWDNGSPSRAAGAGITNSGGGGGGGANISNLNGGNGGSGIVIVRYLVA